MWSIGLPFGKDHIPEAIVGVFSPLNHRTEKSKELKARCTSSSDTSMERSLQDLPGGS